MKITTVGARVVVSGFAGVEEAVFFAEQMKAAHAYVYAEELPVAISHALSAFDNAVYLHGKEFVRDEVRIRIGLNAGFDEDRVSSLKERADKLREELVDAIREALK